ncbi:TIGR02921 family PEP-CTERM protein [Kovacikia minuta CCNUW1]|uniref:TIGR02921 family PEP-CTERM protein n=1 Tax=Kovacikia minuta TaxID=2931930 RepID=UPI001CC950D6|nr:TIGR02921 family PEP-CTERM protein [Kovacikia minuta]UBF25497.1 TIGR02921 family PEP-CTERM protein [Kovacikia minuta CCNUW1]
MNKLFAVFFWIFNATLLLIVYLGVLPFVGLALLNDAATGQVPLNFLVTFVGLVGVPITCSIAGFRTTVRQPILLFELFYGIEAPLLIVCIARFFWLRDLTPPTTFLLLALLVGTIATGHWLLSRRENLLRVNLWHLAGQVLVLTIALYLAALLSFYVLPTIAVVLEASPILLPYALLLLPLTVLILGICTLPFGVVVMYGRSLHSTLKQLGTRYGEWQVRAFSAAVLAGGLGIFLLLQQQPQIAAFRLLNPAPQTDQQRQAVLQKSDVIRNGLLNAYLSAYRYPRSNNGEMQSLYQSTLHVSDAIGQTVQNGFNTLMAPFTYQGTQADIDKAAQLYAQFFDAPILRGEHTAIQKALQSTFDRGAAKAGLDNINQKRVWLEEQHVTVTPQGDWAEVEIYEVYQNKTNLPEEVLYYFSLPESAAVTGLWLSDEATVPKKYPFAIAPRGAAQQVYSNQVQRNVDPALLEQVGPQQYRLRAFPVPVVPPVSASSVGQQKLYLWLRYKVLKQPSGWQLPELREQRNIFWTGATKRLINGKTVSGSDRWLPTTLPAENTPPTSHQMTLPWGAHVLAMPMPQTDYQPPQGKRFAVILDGSRSMEAQRQEVIESFRWLKDKILPQNSVDLYLPAIAPTPPLRIDHLQQSNFDPAKLVFYGMVQPKDLLAQFQQLRGERQYDAILVITDAGSYELNNDTKLAGKMPAPLWFVHLGGLALAYDDATLKAIQDSNGGAATQVQTVMQRIATQPSRGEGTSFLNLVDGYAWFLTREGTSSSKESTHQEFGALAARQWATHLSRYLQPSQMKELDAIHAAAKQYGIVTPYSSMIVLVNNQQRQELKQAEQQTDRFDREVEDAQLPPPPKSNISAVPEPAEWLLLLAAAGTISVANWVRNKQEAGGRRQKMLS